MTLAAACRVDGIPIVFGDILLTWEARFGDPKMPLPSLAEKYAGNGIRSVAGLDHKVVLIGPRCAVAWTCNNRDTALQVISDLRQLEAAGALSTDSLLACVTAHPRFDEDHLAIVGWLVDDSATHHIHIETRFRTLRAFGTIAAAGSGATPCLEMAERIDGTLDVISSGVIDVSRSVSGVVRVLLLISFLVARERNGGANASSLRSGYGGAYEIAYLDGGQFRFLTDYCIHVWYAQMYADDELRLFPVSSYRHTYVDEWLVIDSVHHSSQSVDTYAIAPALFSGANLQLSTRRNFGPKVGLQANAISGSRCGKLVEIGFVEVVGQEAEPKVSIECVESRVVLACQEEFMVSVANAVRRQLDQ